ncbi:MAG: FAD-binding protein, partial [Crocinitomicaceae bacterium]|nr:FAD-binding protein [Crocinitomicaceae bacterium]
MYKTITSDDISFFQSIVNDRCFVDSKSLEKYSKDETEDISILPEVVIKPETVEEISAIMKHCNKERICVTPSGARTGLSGGAIPAH